jgi:hypothetical protein
MRGICLLAPLLILAIIFTVGLLLTGPPLTQNEAMGLGLNGNSETAEPELSSLTTSSV